MPSKITDTESGLRFAIDTEVKVKVVRRKDGHMLLYT
jgi:hypothetical protein